MLLLWVVFICALLLYLRDDFIYLFLQYLWDVCISVLAVLSIVLIIYWLIQRANRENRNLKKPIQQEYTEQDRELVLLCNKHILEIHCRQKYYYTNIPDNDIPYMYMVQVQKETQRNFRKALFVI